MSTKTEKTEKPQGRVLARMLSENLKDRRTQEPENKVFTSPVISG